MTTALAAALAADDTGKAGPLGLLVIVLLGVAVYLLGRSMLRHLKKVPSSFDPPAGPGAAQGATGADGAAGRPAPDGDATAPDA